MKEKNSLKERLGFISKMIAVLAFAFLALDFFDNGKYLFGISIFLVVIVNVFLIRKKGNYSLTTDMISNGLNSLAGLIIAYDHYLNGGRYILWILIAIAFLIVTVMFYSKKRKLQV